MEKLKYKECENCADWKGNISHCMEICGKPLDALEEFNKYKAAGTVEECKSAREKQTPKKVKKMEYYPVLEEGWEYACPNCGGGVGENKKDVLNITDKWDYCDNCGQRLDWSD